MTNKLQDIIDRARQHRKEHTKLDDPTWVNRTLGVKTSNNHLYGKVKWILRSPGNDLLDFYDIQNERLGKDNRAYSPIPPSVVYYYRFNHQYPDELFDKSKNYGINSYLRDRLSHLHNTSDPTYWGQVRTSRFNWLIDKPHEEYVFDYANDLFEYLKIRFNQKAITNTLSVHDITNKKKCEKLEQMFWRGKLKGWSIVVIPK